MDGTGLLYAVQLNDAVFAVVAPDGAEYMLRKQGLGVIHGGHNALRFTPHFRITKEEMDMQVDFVRAFLKRMNQEQYQLLVPRLAQSMGSPKKSAANRMELSMKGHLFDDNIIGEVLNRVEKYEGCARMLQLRLGILNSCGHYK